MRFWLEKGADGFRLDALPFLMETAPDANGIFPDNPPSGNSFLNPDQLGYTTEDHIKDLLELYDVVYEWRDFLEEWLAANSVETR